MIPSLDTCWTAAVVLGGALRPILFVFPLGTVIGPLALACSGSSTAPAPVSPSTVQVVTTTAILADFVTNVGGDRVEVGHLVPGGVDVHSFQSTPGDSIAVGEALVIVSNGTGLDSFLDPVLNSAARPAAIRVVAAQGLKAVSGEAEALSGEGHEDLDDADDEHGHTRTDPHFWQNPLYAVHYVERIRDGLIQADPSGAQLYQDNAAAYIQKLRELDLEISEALSDVPPHRRHLVTFHSAFGHFAKRYGWKVSSLTLGNASYVTPGAMVEVVKRIREEGIPIVFAEPQLGSGIVRQAASDAGVAVGLIYSDVLDATVPTYIDMMRFNVKSLLELRR